jgi:hypothetical protein
MKHLLYILFIAALLTGCATPRKITSTDSQQQRDSVRIEYRERTVLVPDTVLVEIPAQTAERTTPDSLSHLENDYAESMARINQDGSLYHDLKTKPQMKPVKTNKEIQQRDSVRTVYLDRIVKQTITEKVEVEKKLSWWDSTKLSSWRYIALVALITYNNTWHLDRKIIYKFQSRLVVW